MHSETPVTGAILAGGRADRMGGRDKGLIPLNGRPLIEYVIEALAPQVGSIVINANRNIDRYRSYGYPVIQDQLADYPGPLAGMLAALEQIQTGYLLCVPCDGPWLPAELAERLLAAMLDSAAEISCVHDGKRLHPVYALLATSLRQPLAKYIDQGGRGVQRWFKSRNLVQVDFSDCPELFLNINTADELQRVT